MIPSVDFDEMTFAIALFIGGTNGSVPVCGLLELPDEFSEGMDPITLGAKHVLSDGTDQTSMTEMAFSQGITAVWQHYHGDSRRDAICCRLLTSYHVVDRCTQTVPSSDAEGTQVSWASVLVKSEIVKAIASAPLTDDIEENNFLLAPIIGDILELDPPLAQTGIEKFDKSRRGHSREGPADLEKESDTRLATLLIAFEGCVAHLPASPVNLRFRVFEKFLKLFAELIGAPGLELLSQRALSTVAIEFPWLKSARLSSHGKLLELDASTAMLHFEEAPACELALISSLIDFLCNFLGDSVTRQMLTSVWPLVAVSISLEKVDAIAMESKRSDSRR